MAKPDVLFLYNNDWPTLAYKKSAASGQTRESVKG